MRTWDVLDANERTMDVIKGYVEMNGDVENETMKYMGEEWTERQRNTYMCYLWSFGSI